MRTTVALIPYLRLPTTASLGIAILALSPVVHAKPSAAASRVARDGAQHIEGRVTAARARWTHGGNRIVTESTLQTLDGGQITVWQPGGTIDGIGMRVIPSPALLTVGADVNVIALSPGLATSATQSETALSLVEVTTMREFVSLPDSRLPGREQADENRPRAIPFVRTTNKTGAQLYWSSGCVFITFDADGTSHLAGDREFTIMNNVLANWRSSTDSCSYLEFRADTPTAMEVGFDRTNVIKFRDTSWCRPAMGDDPEECYSSAAAGLTTLFFIDDASSDRNGEILDADVELNGVDFAISDNGQTASTQGCLSDLANTLTHEIGHLLGLEHTCWTGVGTRPVDHTGAPVPSCSQQLDAAVTEATMYNFQECGETKKASLEADDLAGLCGIYPIADDPSSCSPVSSGGGGCCSAGPASPAGAAGHLALVLSVFFGLLVVGRKSHGTGGSAPKAR